MKSILQYINSFILSLLNDSKPIRQKTATPSVLRQFQSLFGFLKKHVKMLIQVVVALIMLGMGLVFFNHEKEALPKALETLNQAQPIWVFWGIMLTVLYIVVQGLMYQYSYKAIGKTIRLTTAMSLYLKRNLVSVFLPAGLLTNVLFFNEDISRKEDVTQKENIMAASIFTVASIASVFVLAILVGFSWFLKTVLLQNPLLLISLICCLVFFLGIYGILYKNISFKVQLPPFAARWVAPFKGQTLLWRKAFGVLLLSIGIELIGIAHLYMAVKAVGASADWVMATMGYLMALTILMTSPLMRGIGTIEAVLTLALTHYGLAATSAISAALLFRIFEFWLMLIAGVGVFLCRKDNFPMRTAPTILLAILGSVNIISALTPSVSNRVTVLHEFLPLHWLHASHYMVAISGIIMIGLSIYLWRGLRAAWLLGMVLCGISIVGNIAKGLDYEEALLAIGVLGTLWWNRKEYFVRTDSYQVRRFGLPILFIILSVFGLMAYGFWLLDKPVFGIDLTTLQSLNAAFRTLFLFDCGYQPLTSFGVKFLNTIYVLSSTSLLFTAYLILKPFIYKTQDQSIIERLKAQVLIQQSGNSSLDYFKTYFDKTFFFTENADAFIAYKATAQYAVCLENPVGADEISRQNAVKAFDVFARKNALRTIYYRIPESSKAFYESLGKKTLPIGEEAIVSLQDFNLEGGKKLSIRNSVNKMKRSGFVFKTYETPQRDSLLQQLRAVSDEWLRDTKRSEIGFSQGIFNAEELRGQTIVTVENTEGKIFAFINLIPDSRAGEANFDLMRKTTDAPHGTMDFIFVNLLAYLKSKDYTYINMGMVPLSGITKPTNLPEKGLKIAYENVKRFSHYKGLRTFKEKFNPQWVMHYVVYDTVKDLIALPSVMGKVIAV